MCFNNSGKQITNYIKTVLLGQELQQKKVKIFATKSKDGEYLEYIRNKMRSGRRLSQDEKEFLKIHALNLEKAMRIENERDEFRHRLANCKTKEEAKWLKTSKSLELQIEARATNDLEFIVMRMMTIFDEFADFRKSKEYSDIPDEYEENNLKSA
jgi:hypothetical protein